MQTFARSEPHEPVMVGPRVKAVRLALGLSGHEFSEMIGIDASSLSKIEHGKKPLLPYTAYKIFECYGVDMNFIYLGQVGGLPLDLSKKVISHLNGENS